MKLISRTIDIIGVDITGVDLIGVAIIGVDIIKILLYFRRRLDDIETRLESIESASSTGFPKFRVKPLAAAAPAPAARAAAARLLDVS